MGERLKNSSVNEPTNNKIDKKVFLGRVVAIEGDATWNANKNIIIGRVDNPLIEERRMVDKGTGRIIVFITDLGKSYVANPLLPRTFNIFPEPGDWVKIIRYGDSTDSICYDYVGPIIPSLLNTNDSTGGVAKKNNDAFGNYEIDDAIINYAGNLDNVKNVFPRTKDISIQGRGSAELILSKLEINDKNNPNEFVMLRSGRFINYNNKQTPQYNKNNSFVRVTIEPTTEDQNGELKYIDHIYEPKYDVTLSTTPPKTGEIKTRVDIVGEKIYLFSRPKKNEAYSIPYAELLFQYISQLETWLINHKHGRNGTPSQSPELKLGGNLKLTSDGYIQIPEGGTKIGLTKNIKII